MLMGHSATLVDYPATEAAPNLRLSDWQACGRTSSRFELIRSWAGVKAKDSPMAPVEQIRISQYVSEPRSIGMFGRVVRQIRILSRGGPLGARVKRAGRCTSKARPALISSLLQ